MMLILAHQGGWDELLIMGWLGVLAVLVVRWAERRARERASEDAEPSGGDDARS